VRTFTGELSYGTYLVECRQEGHRTSQKEITLTKENVGQVITLPAPTPIYGSIDVNSSPIDCDVYIDNKKVGTTPMLIEQCLIGNHTIRVTKQGYSEFMNTVTVREGQTENIMARLENGRQITFSDNLSFTVAGVTFEMIPVERGTFIMGGTSEQGSDTATNEKPVHRVTLSSYYIGKTEVTQALWQAVMGTNPSRFKGDNLPVERVNWKDCQEFIRKLNSKTGKSFCLPTEAEWEYAARGGSKSRNNKYSGSSNLGDVAWYREDSDEQTHPVGMKRPNELGIYDMSGNVWEWCSDWYSSYDSASQTNPVGPNSGTSRVIRGGGWGNNASYCRVSYRYISRPSDCGNLLGLRLALSK
jgi:formylglycine-generating enzyme required for sulfatase activity